MKRFIPGRSWGRARIVLFLTGLILVLAPVAALAVTSFSDVPPGYTHEEGINFVAEKGITTGYSDGTYRPSNPVTRGQMATFLHRTAGALVAAGARVNVPVIIGGSTNLGDWFNNVNGTAPSFTKNGPGQYELDFGFDLTGRFVQATAAPTGLFILGTPPGVTWATASVSGTKVYVWTYNWNNGASAPQSADANVSILIY